MPRLLVITAVEAEAEAVLGGFDSAAGQVRGLPAHRTRTPAGLLDVVAGGVGPVAAAVSATVLLEAGYDLVLSAGIGGGFAQATPGSVVVADTIAQADLGSELADGGFASAAELGFGDVATATDPQLSALLARRSAGLVGAVLTVSTDTGTRAGADRLLARWPGALAEAMEGAGVAAAALRHRVAFGELRAISNPVGPRDRAGWQLGAALAALGAAFAAILAEPLDEGIVR
jgi:futalosine hydrolase